MTLLITTLKPVAEWHSRQPVPHLDVHDKIRKMKAEESIHKTRSAWYSGAVLLWPISGTIAKRLGAPADVQLVVMWISIIVALVIIDHGPKLFEAPKKRREQDIPPNA